MTCGICSTPELGLVEELGGMTLPVDLFTEED